MAVAAVGRTAEKSAALGHTGAADTMPWETDIGTTIGAAVTATTGTATHTVAPAGGTASGCAAATARPIGTAIIEGDGGAITVGTALRRTAAGGTSTERKREAHELSGTKVPERRRMRLQRLPVGIN
jgi:hypothetical protein